MIYNMFPVPPPAFNPDGLLKAISLSGHKRRIHVYQLNLVLVLIKHQRKDSLNIAMIKPSGDMIQTGLRCICRIAMFFTVNINFSQTSQSQSPYFKLE
jgi:hypothetical protein